ncbi:MAG: hypothetical protein LBD82_07075 [Deltaproteobacteria bacterium]|jgi:hypothetical protein|nr:hypothetical protein [Deltaproteobacteria bacterium]
MALPSLAGILGAGAGFLALLLALQTLRLDWARDDLEEARQAIALLREDARQADAGMAALQSQVRAGHKGAADERASLAQRQEIMGAARPGGAQTAPGAVVDLQTSQRAAEHINAVLGKAVR